MLVTEGGEFPKSRWPASSAVKLLRAANLEKHSAGDDHAPSALSFPNSNLDEAGNSRSCEKTN